ncbi:cobalt-precorrin-5B (C(1))-methyltransferase CbiD [Synechococcus sp. UW140]|uniref:cobalt-precorrin-5B (C(1))-methyltransferase CbiD n=1 Tax=Synechococcus sp. UW140 TaxID=368503 RepID=UPI000E0E42EF|nr:cobalt-precorrin-5B (C(1))-methyltransferase CbiD [Synechococcus sp. UW140]
MPEVSPSSSSGLTLPMWVAAAARAAMQCLVGEPVVLNQQLFQPGGDPAQIVPVRSVSLLESGLQALAISVCDPGPGLDLTRGLEVWVRVAWAPTADPWLDVIPGAGVGRFAEGGGICLSTFARELLEQNLRPYVPKGRGLVVEVVLPRGRELAQRTSNAAFGVVEGLALIGTQAEVQISASPDQLQSSLDRLRALVLEPRFAGRLTLVIGENGYHLAQQLGFGASGPVLKTGNWIGPMLVAAAEVGVEQLVLLGYQGKLVKLAGGIFHTHHHLADGRLEVLVALAVDLAFPLDLVQSLGKAASVEAALEGLQNREPRQAEALRQAMAAAVEARVSAYLQRYGDWALQMGAVLFDRSRQRRWPGPVGKVLLADWGRSL